MANMDNFIITLKGDVEMLGFIEGIVKEAAYEGGGDMDIFLLEHGINVNEMIDADCHHISLFTYLLGLEKHAKELDREAYRNFISGCDLKDDVLTIYVYGPDGGETFFKHLVALSTKLESCLVVEDEDEDDNYYDFDEDYD